MADHEIQNLHSKQPLNKTQSSKFCKLDVKQTCFQNLKEYRKWFFDHCGTLGNSGLFHRNHRLLKMKIIILFEYLAACVGSYRVFSVYCHEARREIPKFVSKCGIWLTVISSKWWRVGAELMTRKINILLLFTEIEKAE